MDSKLRQLQLEELDILKEFVHICDKYDLGYYLVGGTLLGAVRHSGFIPWDDDIDVAMLRGDYERFAEVCQAELDPQYFYQSSETDPYYFLTYAKIRKNGTEVCEERFSNSKFHKGIFIDIFPLDICPRPGLICHFLFNVLAVMNYRGQVDSGELYVSYQGLSGRIGYTCLKVFGKRELIQFRKQMIHLAALLSRGQFLAGFSGAYGYKKEVFPAEWFSDTNIVVFESAQFLAPCGTQGLLTQLYGDHYMELPKNRQAPHCVLEKSKL